MTNSPRPKWLGRPHPPRPRAPKYFREGESRFCGREISVGENVNAVWERITTKHHFSWLWLTCADCFRTKFPRGGGLPDYYTGSPTAAMRCGEVVKLGKKLPVFSREFLPNDIPLLTLEQEKAELERRKANHD